MPGPLLSAVMIVRDEAEHLERCLRSIRDVVDEIVVVDTGSADGSLDVARRHGARVHEEPWADDFSRPRNIGLDLARGEWILYIDADEELQPVERAAVERLLRGADEVAFRLLLRPFAGATPYREYRLWRSDPRIRFDGIIHEKVGPAIDALARAEGRPIGDCELFLEHFGYEGDQTRKHRRNLPLLRAQLAAEPDNAYNWRHLGTVLAGLGEEAEADVAFERAVEAARRTGSPAGGLAFADLARRRAARGEDVGELLAEGLRRHPHSCALAWAGACVEIEAGRHERALGWLDVLERAARSGAEDSIAYTERLAGAIPADARGVCLFRLARYTEAAAAYAAAERLEPGEPAHRANRMLAEARAGRDRWDVGDPGRAIAFRVADVAVELRADDPEQAAAAREVFGMLPPVAERSARVAIRLTRRAPPIPGRRPDEATGDVRIWLDDAGLALGYRDAVTATVAGARAEIGGEARDLARAYRQLSPFALAHMLGPLDRFVLHGGAVQREGRAVLVLGGSGLGKSTLVAGALGHGWAAMSDDLLVVRAGPAGPEACGVAKPLSVPPEVAEGHPGARRIDDDHRGRWRLEFAGWDRSWRAVAGIVVPGHAPSDDPETESLAREQALALMLVSLLSRRPDDVRRYMAPAAAIAALPAWRLLLPSRARRRAERAAAVLGACFPAA